MSSVRYTLVSEGSSDTVLMPILDWVLHENGVYVSESVWAELRTLPKPPTTPVKPIEKALELYPCDLLFIHRDADNQDYDVRKRWVLDHLDKITLKPPAVCIIPVRMQETWLLIDENAIREAVGKPNSSTRLYIPPLRNLENYADSKTKLHHLLLEASGTTGRNRKKFNVHVAKHRIPQFIKDFSPLRNLSAFAALETDIQTIIDKQGWND